MPPKNRPNNNGRQDGPKKDNLKKDETKTTHTIPSPPLSPKNSSASVGDQSQTTVTDRDKTLPKIETTSDSNASTSTVTTDPAAAAGHGRGPTAAAVTDLLAAMQSTLSAVGNTFDVVGEQTMHVAALGPAVDAMYQIRAVEREVEKQSKQQEEKMQAVKKSLQGQFNQHMREVIRPHVHQIVTDIIKREVAERVRHQLKVQIPSSLREEIRQYKWQIMQVKTSLHNSEARRHNALIRASGLDEPLQALLRPLDTPSTPGRGGAPSDIQSTPRDAHANANSLQTPPCSPLQARLRNVVRGGAGDANRLSLNTNVSSRTSMAVTALGSPTSTDSTGGTAVGVCDVEEPTASPMFPRDLATLVSLGPDEARKLVREYGLIGEDEDEGDVDEEVQVAAVRTPTGRTRRDPRPTSTFTTASDGQSWVNAGLQGSREEDINRFMRFIGVGFQVLPSSPVITLRNGISMTINGGGVSPGSPAIMKSPLVERPDYAFVR